MARRSAVLLDAQPALWGDTPPAEPSVAQTPSKTKPKSKRLRNHRLDLPRPWTAPMPCAALCLVCRRPEDMGACAGGCAIVCGPPDKAGPVEVCLLTLTLPARLMRGRAVVLCPHCDGTHWHQPALGRRYRIGACGQSYIVHVPERSQP
ncbi:hypothetical protein ABZ912_19880 [Nonomuraea angiospora]|uniref:hypothetical protein n=1 Tax=Nonomuraea angiospora TaxID=46172 RepID=UPI0033C883F5